MDKASLKKVLWTTQEQKYRACGAAIGLILALLLPNFGLATRGGGASGWWIAALVFAVIGALIGNLIALKKEGRTN